MPNNYTGTIATTTAGYDCNKWLKNDSDIFNSVLTNDDHNYCRSYNDQSLGAWCYISNSTILWQYCACPVQNAGKRINNVITSNHNKTLKS